MFAVAARFLFVTAVLTAFAVPKANAQNIMQLMHQMSGALECLGPQALPFLCKGDTDEQQVEILVNGVKQARSMMAGTIKDPAKLAAFNQSVDQLEKLIGDLATAIKAEDPKSPDKSKRFEIVKNIGAVEGTIHTSLGVGGHGHMMMMAMSRAPERREEADKSSYDRSIAPIDDTIGDIAPRAWSKNADNPAAVHAILRGGKADFIKTLPAGWDKPTKFTDAFIAGGGISGLYTAHLLKDKKFIIADLRPRLGGNSQAEVWKGIPYTIAASYINPPEKKSTVGKLLSRLGIADKFKVSHTGDDPILFKDGNEFVHNFWDTGTNPQDPENVRQFKFFKQHFENVVNEKNGLKYPVFPPRTDSDKKVIADLDSKYASFEAYLIAQNGGKPLDPDLYRIIDHYCWSAMAKSMKQTSPSEGLFFYAGDFNSMAVFPGGNAAIADALYRDVAKAASRENFLTNTVVFDVRADDNGVNVSYVDTTTGNVTTVRAKTAVLGNAKFITPLLIDDLYKAEPDRAQAAKTIHYDSYIVVNVMLNAPPPKIPFYDLFTFDKKGSADPADTKAAALAQGATDIVNQNFPLPPMDHTVLTFFMGVPYPGFRHDADNPNSYDTVRAKLEPQIQNEIQKLGYKISDIADIRMALWGHPLPRMDQGYFAKGLNEVLSRVYKGRVFALNQDNQVAAFEAIIGEGGKQIPNVRRAIEKSKWTDYTEEGSLMPPAPAASAHEADKKAASNDKAASMKMSGCPFRARRVTN